MCGWPGPKGMGMLHSGTKDVHCDQCWEGNPADDTFRSQASLSSSKCMAEMLTTVWTAREQKVLLTQTRIRSPHIKNQIISPTEKKNRKEIRFNSSKVEVLPCGVKGEGFFLQAEDSLIRYNQRGRSASVCVGSHRCNSQLIT